MKDSLTMNTSRSFYSGDEITYLDLEKKNCTGGVLISGRQLYDMAKRGMKQYKKALSFATRKFDIKTQTPKESGTTIEDVIHYVRCKMYFLLKKGKSSDESESESEEVVDEDATNTNIDPDNDDKLNDESNNDTACGTLGIDVATPKDEYMDEDFEDVPDDYIFPSFVAFIAWGPFASPDEQLNIQLIDETLKPKGKGSRKDIRDSASKDKDLHRSNDNTSHRGLSTAQDIEVEHLKVQQQMMVDRQNETSIVALSIQEAAIGRQLTAAETRAESRCPIYDSKNSFWKRVDVLIKKQEDVMDRISEFTSQTQRESRIPTKKEVLLKLICAGILFLMVRILNMIHRRLK